MELIGRERQRERAKLCMKIKDRGRESEIELWS